MSWHSTAREALTAPIPSAITQDSCEIVGYHNGIEDSSSDMRCYFRKFRTHVPCCFPTNLHVTGHTAAGDYQAFGSCATSHTRRRLAVR